MLCYETECTGCMACYTICSINAIEIVVNQKGFQYPKVNTVKCVSCGLCEKVCQAIQNEQKNADKQKVFACWSKNSKTRRDSSSGGMFYEIASCIINSGGYVCGAAFDKDFNVHHIVTDNIEGLKKIQGSKYVQSDISATYKQVENLLNNGKKVLYSGTPCQIAGIKAYLKAKRINCAYFYSCDLICHGIPSPRIWDEYKQSLQKKYKSKLKKYDFRYKEPGWMRYSAYALFENGKECLMHTNKDKYSRAFLYDYIIRDNCQNCLYTSTSRVADITLADFWGYKGVKGYENDDKGISLAIVNTENGSKLFEMAKMNIVYVQKTLDEAVAGNRSLSSPWPPNERTDIFWRDYFRKGYGYVSKKYLVPIKEKKMNRRKEDILYLIRILPNKISMKILGEKQYSKLKGMLKK